MERLMPVQFTLQCRCGHSAELSCDEWKQAEDMVHRARCSVCGAKGITALAVNRVHFLSKAETERQRIERITGRR